MKFSVKFFILPTSFLLLLTSCNKDGDLVTGTRQVRLTTKIVEGIRSSSALSGGNISNDGGTVITQRGVVWSNSRNPVVSLSTKTSDGVGPGSFISQLTGLTPSTTYFVRAYATTRFGTEYGNEIGFVTATDLPTLTTSNIANITATTVVSGGTISNEGGSPIIARGVVWSTTVNSTVTLSSKTSDGAGGGNYSSTITGLSPGTQYYLRAFATNSTGTSYGNEIAFETEGSWNELDEALITKMNQFDIPGLSVAVIKNEKLVYLKSYGYSDLEENKPAANQDFYRIADVSKFLTWMATLKLAEDWGMDLDDRVFGSNSIFGKDYVMPPAGSGKDLLTVRHFMEHKSGWVNIPYDPMFANYNFTHTQLINDLLMNRPLAYVPGTTAYDLNFGYCVLGRVIEKITNTTYENYVKSIMNEFGVTEIKIGGNALRDRLLPYEVKYYQSENNPYSLNVRRMDSHAGWIASAKDLAKILVRMDGNLNVPDIVSTYLTDQFSLPANWAYYGALPGSSSILHRLDNTFSFIVLTNTRTESNPSWLIHELDNTMTEQIRARTLWPSYDLF